MSSESINIVGQESKVRLHFTLTLEDGSVIDTTPEDEPAELIIGDGNLPEHFEACLLGLKAGDECSFELTPEKAFGQHNPQNIQVFPKTQFPEELELQEGLILSFADAAGNEVPGMIAVIEASDVTVDFNHPLAGKTLTFDVKILACDV